MSTLFCFYRLQTRTLCAVDWLTNLGDVTAGTAIGGICLYFFNHFVIRVLDERNEWLKSVVTDRAEWNAKLERLLDRYDNRVVEVVTALRDAAAQDHALRGKMQEFMLSLEGWMRKRSGGTGGND